MDIDVDVIKASVTKRASFLAPDELSKFASVIALFLEKGIGIDDVFPFGITETPDAISVRGTLKPDQLAQLGEIIPTLEQMKDYRVFSRGIIEPDSYRLHVNLRRESAAP
jgi:hypothetical protein